MDRRVTVLMPAYNAADTIEAAVASILAQSYEELELLVIDDGSSDGTVDVLARRRDTRIRVERNSANLGLPATLDRGLDLARTEYAVRMDADDVALPQRIERQVAFMDAHPEIGVSGTSARVVGHGAGPVWRRPVNPDDASATLLFGTPFIHPTVILRRAWFAERGLRYDPSLTSAAEDWDLWRRAGESMRFANLTEVLHLYRVRIPSGPLDQHGAERRIRKRADVEEVAARMLRQLGAPATAEDARLHAAICLLDPLEEPDFLARAEAWLVRLLEINSRRGLFPVDALARQTAHQWFATCHASARNGQGGWRPYLRSRLSRARRTSPADVVRLALASARGIARSARAERA